MTDLPKAPIDNTTLIYRTFFIGSLAVLLVAAVSFASVLYDSYSVSPTDLILPWVAFLTVLATVSLVGHALRSQGKDGLAILVLSITAIPGFIFLFLVTLLFVFNPRWN